MNTHAQAWATHSANPFTDIGSSINIVFTPDWSELVVGLSKKKPVYKHPCGKIEECDVPSAIHLNDKELEDLTAANCARRELFRETGIIDTEHEERIKLTYVRTFSGAQGKLRQYHFLVLLKEKLELEQTIIEAEEMNPPEYWPVIMAIKGGEGQKKLNPYHQLALCKCLQEMVEAGLGHDPHFPGFRKLLENIYDAGIELDAYTVKLQGMIERREI